jgi:hypothetical protein
MDHGANCINKSSIQEHRIQPIGLELAAILLNLTFPLILPGKAEKYILQTTNPNIGGLARN